MPFAEIAFKQTVGDSRLTISEVGCYVTSFANILEKVGVNVDPPTLNIFFTDHKVYTFDKTDRANDDLYWSSVTSYKPQLVVAQTGGAGFPNLDLAIVEFHYRSVQHPILPNGQPNMITHFCAVNHVADHSIIDSYDGRYKTPAEYEHVYGQPIAWATYVFHTPATTPTSLSPAAPVSAPTAHTVSVNIAPSAPHTLYLPPSVAVWHVYNPSGPWTLPHSTHVLSPKMYGGLTYDILGNPAPNIYLIKTQMYGEVAIYAGPDTVAQFPGTGRGEGEDTTAPVASIPVSEVVPAPTPAPVPAPPTPAITYKQFPDGPMELVTKEGAQTFNFVTNMIIENKPAGTPFVAVGKATLPDNTTFYMEANDFGGADVTQQPNQPVGIKTTDLSQAPKAVEADNSAGIAVNVAVHSSATASSLPLTTSATAPDISAFALPWQRTMQFFAGGPRIYVAKQGATLFEFPGGNAIKQLQQGANGEIAGRFIFAGSYYYRPKQSVDAGTWEGILVTALDRQGANNTPFDTNDDVNQLGYELDVITKQKHAVLKAGGSADGFLARFKKQRSM